MSLQPAALRELHAVARLPADAGGLIFDIIDSGSFGHGGEFVGKDRVRRAERMDRSYNALKTGHLRRNHAHINFLTYYRYRADGRCVDCGKPAAVNPNGTLAARCRFHLDKNNRQTQASYRRHKERPR